MYMYLSSLLAACMHSSTLVPESHPMAGGAELVLVTSAEVRPASSHGGVVQVAMTFLTWCALIGIVFIQSLLHLQCMLTVVAAMNTASSGRGRELEGERTVVRGSSRERYIL